MGTYLIVGADRGIGEALCLQLCARGKHVIATCLDGSSRLTEQGARVETGVEVTSDAAVHAFAQRMIGTHVDGEILACKWGSAAVVKALR